MSVAKKLLTGSALRTLNLALNIGISFFMMPFLIHALGDGSYGIWTLVSMFMGYYGLIDLGMSATISRFVATSIGADDIVRRKVITSTSFYIFVGLGCLAAVATLIATTFADKFSTPDDLETMQIALIIMGLSLASTFPVRVFSGALTANLRYDITTTIDLVTTVVRTGLFVLVILQGYGVIGLAAISTLMSLLSSALIIFFAYRTEPGLTIHPRYFSPGMIKELLSFSSYLLISRIANILKYKVDSFVIAAHIGLGAVTHYVIATRLMDYFIDLISQIMGVVGPVFGQYYGKKDFQAIKDKFFFLSKISFAIAGFAGLMAFCYAEVFINTWMGPEYMDSVEIIHIVAIPIMLGLCQSPLYKVLVGIAKHRLMTFIGISEGIANLTISLSLVDEYGIKGVALGTAIPMVISALILYPLYLCHAIKLSPIRYYLFITKNFVLSALLVVGLWLLISDYVQYSYLSMISFGLLQAIVYFAGIYFLSFNAAERQYLTNVFFERKAIVNE